jgi:hypothetical protein
MHVSKKKKIPCEQSDPCEQKGACDRNGIDISSLFRLETRPIVTNYLRLIQKQDELAN